MQHLLQQIITSYFQIFVLFFQVLCNKEVWSVVVKKFENKMEFLQLHRCHDRKRAEASWIKFILL